MKFTTIEICKNINVVEEVPILCRNILKYYADKRIKADSFNSTEIKGQHRYNEKGF